MENATLPMVLTTVFLKGDEMCLMPQRLKVFSIVTYSLIFLLGTLGNGLVIFILGFRMKKTVNTVWILNLAAADFTFSFVLVFHVVRIARDFHWSLGRAMCILSHAMVFLAVTTSIYLLVVISVDRCVAVWRPLWARSHRTPRLASFVVLGVWILALVLCGFHLYFAQNYYASGRNQACCLNHYEAPYAGGTGTQYATISVRFLIIFLIPFIIIVVCYGGIAVKLKRDRLSQSSKPFKIITAVIVGFFVCWFPFHVFSFLKVKTSDEVRELVVSKGLPLSVRLTCFTSCLNPILYFCMGQKFKEKLRCSLLSALGDAFTEEGNPPAHKHEGPIL